MTEVSLGVLARDEAERLSVEISARLDSMADHYLAVMPMIREALTRQAYVALGYRSAGEYAAKRFGDALSKLDPAMRREVVIELTEAGMSTRAIAPVVGASQKTVDRDRRAGESHDSPAVTGIDGKRYSRPAPVVASTDPDALVDQFPELAHHMNRGRVEDVVRLGSALRQFGPEELEVRLDALRKTIAAEVRDEQGQPHPRHLSVVPAADDDLDQEDLTDFACRLNDLVEEINEMPAATRMGAVYLDLAVDDIKTAATYLNDIARHAKETAHAR